MNTDCPQSKSEIDVQESTEYKTVGFPKSNVPTLPANSTTGNQERGRRSKRAMANPPSAAMPSAPPLPKRPKGRWFITAIILTVGFVVTNSVWNNFFRFSARGTIEGRVIEVRVPWDGIVQSIHARDGEFVEQGQMLATLHNYEIANRQKTLKAELQIALASLSTRIAEIQAAAQAADNATVRLNVEYYQLLGRNYSDKAKLKELESDHASNVKLLKTRSIPRNEVTASQLAVDGQTQLVSEQSNAIIKLREKLDRQPDSQGLYEQRLSSALIRISNAEEELNQLDKLEQLGEIRAPVSGKIIRRHHFTGEHLTSSELLFDVLEEGSLEAILYITQENADQVRIGETVDLLIAPSSVPQPFVITRIADQMVNAPAQIKRYYMADEKLIPVVACPAGGSWNQPDTHPIGLGAEVRLPRFASSDQTAIAVFDQISSWFEGIDLASSFQTSPQ